VSIEFEAIEFESAAQAIQHANASGCGYAILHEGRHLVVSEQEAERLAAAGVEFAYLVECQMASGMWRIVTVPVNRD